MQELRIERSEQVAHLIMDRPAQRNAFSQQMWLELPRLLDEICFDPALRVLLLRSSTTGVFSSGADIGEYRDNAGDVAWGMQSQERVSAALRALRDCPIPTVAAIDGGCVGGGAGLALACDLRVATRRSKFGVTPAKLGLIYPAPDLQALVRTIGPSAAKRLLFTGDLVDADWALQVGLVDELCEPSDFVLTVHGLVSKIAAVAPGSVRAMKQMVNRAHGGAELGGPELDLLVSESLAGSEHREGIAAFLERRPPRFGSE